MSAERGIAYMLDVSPGNGTRYRLVVAIGSTGTIDCVAWPDFQWSVGDFGRNPPSAEWMSGHGINMADGYAAGAGRELAATIHVGWGATPREYQWMVDVARKLAEHDVEPAPESPVAKLDRLALERRIDSAADWIDLAMELDGDGGAK